MAWFGLGDRRFDAGRADRRDLRHDPARRRAARGAEPVGGRQAPRRASPRRARRHVRRAQVAGLEPERRRSVRAGPRRRVDDGVARGVRLAAPGRLVARRGPAGGGGGGAPIGGHAHYDSGCAVANSLAALRACAGHVQGTLNGYGERCGNANLCSIVPNLELKMGRPCLREGALATLTHVAWQAAEIANLAPDAHAAYVGRSAFAHKGGVHVAAIRRHPRAYEHVDPALVGNKTRVVVSELSGRGNLLAKAEEFEVTLEAGATTSVLRDLKEREARGFAFEAAEASVALMMRRESVGYGAPFELVDYKVIVGRREREEAFSEATIKIRVRGEIIHTAA